MPEITISISGLSHNRLAIIIGGAIVSVALAILAILYINQHTALTGLPRDSYKDLTFQVFFPKHPPQGFQLDRSSISSTSQVLAYKYDYEGKKPVYVSIQPLDPQLDITSFKPTREIGTDIGHGYLAEYDTRTTIAIIAGKSMVLINSPDQIPSYAIEQFANSLKPVK